MRNLGPQFKRANDLHSIPVTAYSDKPQPRMVPTALLHDAYSAEYDVPAHQIGDAREKRIQEQKSWSLAHSHSGDHPGAQESLQDSIKYQGIHEPLNLSYHQPHNPDGEGEWSIRDGSHRLLAAQTLGLSHVPVVHTR